MTNTDPIRPIHTAHDGVRLGRAEHAARITRRRRPADDDGQRGNAHGHEQPHDDEPEEHSIWTVEDTHEAPARAAGAYDPDGTLGPLVQAQRNLLRHLDTTA